MSSVSSLVKCVSVVVTMSRRSGVTAVVADTGDSSGKVRKMNGLIIFGTATVN